MHKVLITRKLAPDVIAKLQQTCELDVWDEDTPIPRAELSKRIVGKAGVLCLVTDQIDAEVIAAGAATLKTVSTMSVGHDHIDMHACAEHDIRVGHTPDVLTDGVADYTISLMIMAGRRINEATQAARDGTWDFWRPYWLTGIDLHHATVGIVGLGRIGEAVAQRLQGFDCRVLYTSRSHKPEIEKRYGVQHAALDDLLAQSDFVTVHCPLTPETKLMFNATRFSQMKSSAIFVNTSRGGLVDQTALYNALKNHDIGGAALDVTTPEPLPLDDPLFTLPNCILSPHIGSASVKTRHKMGLLAADNLLAGLKGLPLPYQVKPIVVEPIK